MAEALNAKELALRMGVTRGRISQLLAEGKLEGTYTGEGRERRYDLEKVAAALNLRLNLGQQTGNGARAAAKRAEITGGNGGGGANGANGAAPIDHRLVQHHQRAAAILAKAKADKAEIEVREMRRRAAAQEGRWVLASEVEREVRQAIASEVAEFEAAFRMAARRVADECGADFREVKRVLARCWRDHRAKRSEILAVAAAGAELSPAEAEDEPR